MTVMSNAELGRPIDWQMPSRSHACRTSPAVYSLPRLVCKMTPGSQTVHSPLRAFHSSSVRVRLFVPKPASGFVKL